MISGIGQNQDESGRNLATAGIEMFATADIFDSEGNICDIVALVAQAGYDPHIFFKYGDFPDIDLRNSNIRGVSFYRCNLDGALLYQDQLDLIRFTGPRSLRRLRISKREAPNLPSIEMDAPSDAVDAFLIALNRLAEDYARAETVNYTSLIKPLKAVPNFKDRLRLFQILWQTIPLHPRLEVLDALEHGMSITEIRETLNAVTPDDSDHATAARMLLFRKSKNISESAKILRRFAKVWNADDDREWSNLGFCIQPSDDIGVLKDALVELRVQPNIGLFNKSSTGFSPGQMDDVERILAMMDALGVQPILFNLQKFAQACGSSADGKVLLDLMDARGMHPDAGLFSALAESRKTPESWKALLDEMVKRDEDPTASIFTIFVKHCKTFADVDTLLSLMDHYNVKCDQSILQPMISNFAKNITDAKRIFDIMESRDVRPNQSTFVALSNHAKSTKDIELLFEIMKDYNVPHTGRTFNSLATHMSSIGESQRFLKLMEDINVAPSPIIFVQLAKNFSKSVDFEKLFDLMKLYGVHPRDATSIFSVLASNLESGHDGEVLLKMIKSFDVKTPLKVFYSLAKFCRNPADAERLEQLMNQHEVEPDDKMQMMLANARNRSALEQQDASAKNPTEATDTDLQTQLGNQNTLAAAAPIAAKILANGEKPLLAEVNRLLKNARKPSEASRIYQAITEWGLQPNPYNFNTLIAKQVDYEVAWHIIRTQKPAGVKLHGSTFNPLLRMARNFDEVMETLNAMRAAGVRLDAYSIKSLLSAKGPTDDDFLEALRWMMQMGLDLERVDMTVIGLNADKFTDLRARL